jgi:hypothetical protein
MRDTRRCRSVCASSSDHAHSKSSVGMPGVPTTVSSLENFVESLDGIYLGKVTGLLQIAKQLITLGIDVRRGVMCDLARRVTEAYARVIDRSPNPHGTAIAVHLVSTPKPHMVTLSWIVPNGLLKGQVFLAAP